MWRARDRECSRLPSELLWLSRLIRPLFRLHIASFVCIAAGSFLALLTPLVLKWVIDKVIPQKQIWLLLFAVFLIFVGYQGRTAFTSVGSYLMLSAAQKMGLTLRMSVLRHLDTLSADYYENTSVGTVMYPFKEPIDEVSYFGSDLIPAIVRTLLTTSFTVATMFTLSPTLTLAILSLVPAFLIARQHFRQKLTADSELVQSDRAAWSDFLEEHLSSVIPIQLLGQQKRQERRAFQRLARSVRSQQRLFRSGVWFTVGSSLAVVLSMCSVIGYGGLKVLAGSLSVGSLVAFYSFITQLFEPLSGAAELYARTQKTFASIRQVQAAMALNPTVVNGSVTIRLSQNHPTQIDFTGVEFGYGRRKNMLHIPSLRIVDGERIAIVGDNGAGKSTLAKLLARIYDVDSGCIYIGGKDIRAVELESLRRHICYLPREPVLFNGTLASNLLFVSPTASNHELLGTIQAVGLAAFVATLPEGLHQRIGPGACQLSGGQRQRLAIARALLLRPRIVVVDEATSCLDPSSEEQLLRTVYQTLCSSMLVVISHRLSTLASFERVVVLNGGRIVEDGNPSSFLAAGGTYSRLFSSTATINSDQYESPLSR